MSATRTTTKREVATELSRRSLLAFTQRRLPTYKAGWFHEELCDILEQFLSDALAGKHPRVMIFAPPQHGKSELVSRSFPAWAHGNFPHLRIVGTSYAAALAEKNVRDVQTIMEDPTYTDTFTTRIPALGARKGVRTSSEHGLIGSAGSLRGVGVGGSLTGFPFDIGIIDDPYKDHAEAYSATVREGVWNWYQTVFERRISPTSGIIIINTRWHEDDLCARLLEAQGERWKVYNFKGLATEDEKHRKTGEALTPERYSADMLREFQRQQPAFFSALYQGEPTTEGGNSFKDTMFEFGPMPQRFDWRFVTADTSYKEKMENDFTCFSAWGVLMNNGDPRLFLEDCLMERMKSVDAEAKVEPFIRKRMGYGFRRTLIEPKGHGIYLNQAFAKKGLMIPSESELKEFFADRRHDKMERANNVIPYLSNRKVIINENLANRGDLVAQALGFPKAKHDDFVDTLVDALKKVYASSIGILDVL